MRSGKYVAVATYHSSSSNAVYTVSKDTNGNVSCNCPGWTRHVKSDGSRYCKHIRQYEDHGGTFVVTAKKSRAEIENKVSRIMKKPVNHKKVQEYVNSIMEGE